jgi:hypothetical protein
VLEVSSLCHHQWEAKRDFEFIGEDRDRQLESLWRETKIGNVLPWEVIADEAERLSAISKIRKNAGMKVTTMESKRMTKRWRGMKQTPATRSLGKGDLTLSWSIGPTRSFLCWNSSVRRINDEITENGGNLEQWPNTTSSSEEKVAGDAEGENGGWKIKLIIFVGGTSESVHAQNLNDNLKELQVIESNGMRLEKVLFMSC